MPGKPRLDKTDRLLHRFYEPLVLLTILRPSAVTNRSSHTSTTSSSDAQGQLGIFLDSLSWICDYGLGGCTVSAVAAEDDPGGPIYWVAAPGSPEAKVRVHLYDIFELLRTAHGVSEEAIKDLEQQIAAKCINFSRKKVLHYHRKLKIGIARVQKHSLEGSQDLDKGLIEDLQAITELAGVSLCQSCYSFRHTSSLNMLIQKHNGLNGDSLWSDVLHYIGRLGSWTKAARLLVKTAAQWPRFVDGCTVKQLGLPAPVQSPEADSLTTLESALGRMLPAGSEDRQKILDTLQDIRVFDVASEFRSKFTETFKPSVHAEAALLEHFFHLNLQHLDQYRYIGCSKPSCYCCDLYFRYHPGKYVQRPYHGNVWKNWRAPLLPSDVDKTAAQIHTRDILNSMIKEIRSQVLFLVKTKASAIRKIPDSTTGISASNVNVPWSKTGPALPRGSALSIKEGHTLAHVDSGDGTESLGVPAPDSDWDVQRFLCPEHGVGSGHTLNTPVKDQASSSIYVEDEDQEVIVFRGRGAYVSGQ